MSYILQQADYIFASEGNVFSIRDTFTNLYNIYAQYTGGHGLMFDPNPANHRFFLCSGNSVTVIDSRNFSTIAIISGLYNASYMTWDPVSANNRFFVNTVNGVYAIDATTFNQTFLFGGFSGICGIAVDLNNTNHLFVCSSDDEVHVMDLTTLSPVTAIPGFSNPSDIIYDEVTSRNRFFVANGDTSEIWVHDGTSYAVLQKISGGGISHPDALSYDPNPANNRIIVGSFYGNAQYVDLGTLAVTSELSFSNVTGVAFDSNPAINRVLVFDLGRNYLVEVIQTPS